MEEKYNLEDCMMGTEARSADAVHPEQISKCGHDIDEDLRCSLMISGITILLFLLVDASFLWNGWFRFCLEKLFLVFVVLGLSNFTTGE
jgi:hypothetical protein